MIRNFADAISESDLMDTEREPAPDPESITHIIPCTARAVNRNQFRALCGALVKDFQHVAANPDCENCRRQDEEDERSLLALQQMPPAERPVKSTWFDPTADDRPKGSRR